MTTGNNVCNCGNSNSYYSDNFGELSPVLSEYADTKGSLITILQKTQDIYGYIPLKAIDYISQETGIPSSKIYGVATFYAQFRLAPIGKNLIMQCQGTACHVNGASEIERAINEHLGIKDGETTDDGLFTLDVVACLGCCSLAPVMMVKKGNETETYGNLTKESVTKILDQIREIEQQEEK